MAELKKYCMTARSPPGVPHLRTHTPFEIQGHPPHQALSITRNINPKPFLYTPTPQTLIILHFAVLSTHRTKPLEDKASGRDH